MPLRPGTCVDAYEIARCSVKAEWARSALADAEHEDGHWKAAFGLAAEALTRVAAMNPGPRASRLP